MWEEGGVSNNNILLHRPKLLNSHLERNISKYNGYILLVTTFQEIIKKKLNSVDEEL